MASSLAAWPIIFERIVLAFPNAMIVLLVFPCFVNKFCFMYFEATLLVAYQFRIIVYLPN